MGNVSFKVCSVADLYLTIYCCSSPQETCFASGLRTRILAAKQGR
ncbi:hypothetical protein QWZ13_14215 [Reinekea marina]|nr:hypothetical protein [Reinekea marina]MDN3650071.1 hypothetical protein [Reinekea marina]